MRRLPAIEVAGRRIGDNEPCFIVADIGQTHGGCAYAASRLIGIAAKAGCDAAKLCKRDIDTDLTQAEQAREGDFSHGKTYGEHRKALELSAGDHLGLRQRVQYNEWPIMLFSTVCDAPSLVALYETLDPPYPVIKIASRDLDNYPLLDLVGRLRVPVILSTGMHGQQQIGTAIEMIRQYHDQIIVLHCISKYPHSLEASNLRRMQTIRNYFKVLVGWSDHTEGIHVAARAAALGACVVEKHIMLHDVDALEADRRQHSDIAVSAGPNGIRALVGRIRNAERCLGTGELEHTEDVMIAKRKLGRSLTSLRRIEKGEPINLFDLCLKSPGNGMGVGTLSGVQFVAARDIEEDRTLVPEDVRIVQFREAIE